MGTGDDTASHRLRLLQAYYVEPGRSGTPGQRSAPTRKASAPLNLGIVSHMAASVAEVEQHTRAAAPQAGPRPAEAHKVYDWMREHTAHLDHERQLAREAIIYRQGLEHAICMGNTKIVRRHRCPGCGCVGLFWDSLRFAAVCVNRYCTDDDGMSSAWSLARLAQQHVAAQETFGTRAT